jgi:hypothetical protein
MKNGFLLVAQAASGGGRSPPAKLPCLRAFLFQSFETLRDSWVMYSFRKARWKRNFYQGEAYPHVNRLAVIRSIGRARYPINSPCLLLPARFRNIL